MESLINQINAFAVTIVIGLAVGFFYDYYRVVRIKLRLKKAGSYLGDIIFWLLTTMIVFFMLLQGNCGELRLYVFIGLGLGGFVYYRLFSNIVCRFIQYKFFFFYKTWQLLVQSFLFIWKVIKIPFNLLFLILSYPYSLLQFLSEKVKVKVKRLFHQLVGRRLALGVSKMKARLAALAFWKKEKKS